MLKTFQFSIGASMIVAIAILALSVVLSDGHARSSDGHAGQRGFQITESAILLEPKQERSQEASQDPAGLDRETSEPTGFALLNSFTYQGVLADLSGDPVVGPAALRFEYVGIFDDGLDPDAEFVMSDTEFPSVMPDEHGRFQVQVPVPSASIAGSFREFVLRIYDSVGGEQIGGDLPVHPTPYAWVSEYSKVAGRLQSEYALPISLNSDFFGPAMFADQPIATRFGNLVILSGDIDVQVGVNNPVNLVLGTLSAGLRPADSQVFVTATASGIPDRLTLRINGGMIFVPSFEDIAAGTTIHLDGIVFIGD